MNKAIEYYWDDPNGDAAFYGTIKPNQMQSQQTHIGHKWYFTPMGSQG